MKEIATGAGTCQGPKKGAHAPAGGCLLIIVHSFTGDIALIGPILQAGACKLRLSFELLHGSMTRSGLLPSTLKKADDDDDNDAMLQRLSQGTGSSHGHIGMTVHSHDTASTWPCKVARDSSFWRRAYACGTFCHGGTLLLSAEG